MSVLESGLQQDVDQMCINTIRFLAVDAVQKANSGHPGMPMGCAPMAYVLWQHFLKHNPTDPTWVDRDRFVLSAGHGSMLLYSLLHLTGYPLSMNDLKSFRQWGSATPGHPENFETAGVETTTGPLGQGVSNAVGFAIAEAFLAKTFNRPGFPVVDHYTYGIASDGDLMEGVSHEAASLAGHLGLGKLIFFYDDNEISIDGRTSLSFTEDVGKRFEAYGWQVLAVEDGNDLEAITVALEKAKGDQGRPTLIQVQTIIGYGSPNKQDTAGAHGSPLGDDEVALSKRTLGWPDDAFFHVPEEVRSMMDASDRGQAAQSLWNDMFSRYQQEYPGEAAKFLLWQAGKLPDGWGDAVPTFEPGSKMATRASSGKVLNAVAGVIENLIGGSADLTGSNKTAINGRSDFQKGNEEGSYFYFGVREHGMAAICNGIAVHGSLRPFCATFLVFSDYMRPSIRLAALMGAPVIYVFTHDSIGLGEDGPTHQPVEHYMALRAIPNLTFIRPAEANETAEAWRAALLNTSGPTALSLTRQNTTTFPADCNPASGLHKGAYVLWGSEHSDVALISTGSEVEICLEAARSLSRQGVATRVVSMPSWELFAKQSAEYRDSVLPTKIKARIAVEAGISMGWERFVGPDGDIVALDRFGASAPAEILFEKFGFTVENIVDSALALHRK